MMDLSFRWPHPRIVTPLGEISIRLHTFDNLFAVDPDSMETSTTPEGTTVVHSSRLAWAGGQKTCDGYLTASIAPTEQGFSIEAEGHHLDGVRSIAITLHDVPRSTVRHLREGALELTNEGRIVRYPDGWWDLATPFLTVDGPNGSTLSIRSTDHMVRPKTFAFVPHFDDPDVMDVELFLEADATDPSTTLTAPAWVLQRTWDLAPIVVQHRQHVEATFPVDSWETRDDVPGWARETSLILNLHGQHFTGRTFLDYNGMLATLRELADRIDPRRILAFLPGWEGRYYRWYGRYAASEDLGGEKGFADLIDGAHALGARVMPMFGANIGSRDIDGYERWGEPGRQLVASGLAPVGSVDWDASRHYDHGFGAVINTAYRPWRRRLVEQISSLHKRFGFDASFLDISALYANDPRGSTVAGIRSLGQELHDAIPGHLLAGEGWFDALSDVIPLVQAGHRNNVPAYHDQPDEALFTRSNRAFGHVNLGDPAHGSSGVHEAGYVSAWRTPVRRGVIPTMSVVDDTLRAAPDRVALILEDANTYAELYL